MDDDYPPVYIREHPDVLDRFTFDELFKRLLTDGYDHEEAKDIIVHNCALSLLIIQGRLHNNYYLEISTTDEISPDLMELRAEIANRILHDKILDIL
jgi:hypothetical protein